MTVLACPECGSEIPDEDTFGLCPVCLLDAGMADVPISAEDTVVVSGTVTVSDTEDAIPSTFGGYELLDEIARGGMGVVYRARQRSLDRLIALKMIRSGRFASGDEVQRFHAEAAAAAKLDHPNIVPIYEVGEVDGQNYFSMAYVEGQSLAERIAAGPMAVDEAAAIVRQIAVATAYAHSQDVIHRDLKPANVLLDKSGKVRVTDYGLAKSTGQDGTLTATGQVLGTPSFMPPEQASSEHGKVNFASDVYSMGAILYAACTGRPPFQAATAYDTIDQVIRQEVVTPRSLNPAIPLDLETICLKCLEKESRRRYESAQALADELTRFLNQEPIEARPATGADRLLKWCRRRPALAAMSCLAVVMTIAALLASSIGIFAVSLQAQKQKLVADEAVQAKQDAEEKNELAIQRLTDANLARRQAERAKLRAQGLSYNLTLARAAQLSDHSPAAARDMLDNEELCPKDFRDFTWHFLRQTVSSSQFQFNAESGVKCLNTDVSGEWLLTGHSDGSIRRWNMQVGNAAGVSRQAKSSVRCLAVAPNGEGFAFGTEAGRVYFAKNHDLEQTQFTLISKEDDPVSCLQFSPDGTRLSWSLHDAPGKLKIWSLRELRREKDFQPPGLLPHSIERFLYTNADEVVIVGQGKQIHLWNLATGSHLRNLEGHMKPVTAVAHLPVRNRLVSASEDKSIKIWNLQRGGRPEITLRGFDYPVVDLAITFDERVIACDRAGTITIWDLERRRKISETKEHQLAQRIALTPSTNRLISASSGVGEGKARVWLTSELLAENTTGIEPVQSVLADRSPVQDISFDEEKSLIVSTRDTTMSIGTSSPTTMLKHPSGSKVRHFPAADVAVSAHRGFTRVARLSNGEVLFEFPSLDSSLLTPDWHPSLNLLAYHHRDGQVRIRDLRNGKERTVGVSSYDTTVVRFQPTDDPWIAIGNGFGIIHAWKIAAKPHVQTLRDHTNIITDLAFSADGRLLGSSSRDDSATVWRLRDGVDGVSFRYPQGIGSVEPSQSWHEQTRILGHTSDVETIAFSADNLTFATAAGSIVRLCDPLDGYERASISVGTDSPKLHAIQFSQDGMSLAVGGEGRVWQWQLR